MFRKARRNGSRSRGTLQDPRSIAPPDTVLASSTSGLPASAFTEGLEHRHRCLVVHPINPPHLIPLGRDRASALDRRRRCRTRNRSDARGRPIADPVAPRDQRLCRQPASERAARARLSACRRRDRDRRRSRSRRFRRSWSALVFHGAVSRPLISTPRPALLNIAGISVRCITGLPKNRLTRVRGRRSLSKPSKVSCGNEPRPTILRPRRSGVTHTLRNWAHSNASRIDGSAPKSPAPRRLVWWMSGT